MHRIYCMLGLGIVALGAVHIATTPRYFEHMTGAAVWFAGGGLAIVLTGALNLLRRTYGAVAPGLRRVCVAANAVMIGFALLAGYVARASVAEFALVLGLIGGATVLSMIRAAQRPGAITPLKGQGT